jgi:ATP-dependent 26S proteasome regulatory subunit
MVIKNKQEVLMLAQYDSDLSLRRVGTIKKELIRENYDKDVILGYNYVIDNIHNDNCGRLIILSGPPGTGKSYFIRGLISEVENAIFILLQSNLLCSLDQPSFIPLLMNYKVDGKPFIFIIEDADSYLVSRDINNMTSISSLLNYCDGMFGAFLNLRIIATTNAHELQIDEALKRPGRLLLHQKIDLLNTEQANEIYNKLEGNKNFSFNKPTSLAEVYAKAYGSKIEIKKEEKKLGFC